MAAGFSPGEADQLRRSMAAWKRRGGMSHFRDKLIAGMLQRGYELEFAERIFRQIEGFGEYGFPESHAASFALLVYVSCWLKRHEPAAFLAALLNSQPMGFYAPAQLVRDARQHGIRVLPVETLRALRALCDAKGLLLILDEIQCGMGRTGRLFHHEWAGITPDIMTIAKGIGGGFPLGACLATEAAAAGMTTGTHGSTYGGNPLACAVGCAVMDIVTAPGFLDRVSRLAGRLRQGLEGLVAAPPGVFEAVRGEGLMLGLKCRMPVGDVVRAGYDARVLVVPAAEDVARILPALNLSEAEAEEGLRRLDAAAAALEAAA